jgi:nucleoid-associated protein YgaU
MAVIAYPLASTTRSRTAAPRRAQLALVGAPPRPVLAERAQVLAFHGRPHPVVSGARLHRSRRFSLHRRILATAGIVAVAAAMWIGLGALQGLRTPARVELVGATVTTTSVRYTVRPGDTLWSIATAVDPGADPRPLVDELAARFGAVIHPGETLTIPRS